MHAGRLTARARKGGLPAWPLSCDTRKAELGRCHVIQVKRNDLRRQLTCQDREPLCARSILSQLKPQFGGHRIHPAPKYLKTGCAGLSRNAIDIEMPAFSGRP